MWSTDVRPRWVQGEEPWGARRSARHLKKTRDLLCARHLKKTRDLLCARQLKKTRANLQNAQRAATKNT
jgi:hypothetical protein